MRRLIQLTFSNTSQTVALASAMSFGVQVVFALLMLRWFTPHEVGEFSVISQIAFFWMTLALAQAPLTLLVNQSRDAYSEARTLWQSSMLRGGLLTPLALLALWISQLNMVPALWWVLSIALCQLSWSLAQSFVLRTGASQHQIFVRVVPPLCSVLAAGIGSQFTAPDAWQGPTLLVAALFGYFVGALWLLPVWPRSSEGETTEAPDVRSKTQTQTDNRSSFLKLAHTAMDVLLATALIVVWQRIYGAQDTGWLSALLRVFGFVPAVIHMAWAQVKLTQAHQDTKHSIWVGITGCVSLVAIGLAGLFALHMQWLDAQWQGVAPYIWPLVTWQGCACLSAAFSYRAFQAGVAKKYSIICIGIAVAQLVSLLTPILFKLEVSAITHLIGFAMLSSLCLLVLAKWMRGLR